MTDIRIRDGVTTLTFDGKALETTFLGGHGRYPVPLIVKAECSRLTPTGKLIPPVAGTMTVWYHQNAADTKTRRKEFGFGPVKADAYRELAAAINDAVAARKAQRQ